MDNLAVKDLRKLVKLYNLEVHIKGSSKMKKDELKSSLLKHLEINEDGELKHKILTNTYKIEKGELKPVERKKKEEVKKEEEQRKKEEEMMMKEDVNVKAKPKEKTEQEKMLEEAEKTKQTLDGIIRQYKEIKEKYQKDSLKESFKYFKGLYQALSKEKYPYSITGVKEGEIRKKNKDKEERDFLNNRYDRYLLNNPNKKITFEEWRKQDLEEQDKSFKFQEEISRKADLKRKLNDEIEKIIDKFINSKNDEEKKKMRKLFRDKVEEYNKIDSLKYEYTITGNKKK